MVLALRTYLTPDTLRSSRNMEHTSTPSGKGPLVIAPGTWGHKKFLLRNLHASLSDTDLLYVVGEEEQLLGRIMARLNMSAQAVTTLIHRL